MDPQIEILFKEYDSLRHEIVARTNQGYQLAAVGVVGVAAIVSWIVSAAPSPATYIAIISIAALSIYLTSYALNKNVQSLAHRLRQLERLINKQAQQHDLLRWELDYAWKNRTPLGNLRSGKTAQRR